MVPAPVPPPEANGGCEEKITLETLFFVWLNSCPADSPAMTGDSALVPPRPAPRPKGSDPCLPPIRIPAVSWTLPPAKASRSGCW
ncbi:hypothetical protein [Azospirillum argentinense]